MVTFFLLEYHSYKSSTVSHYTCTTATQHLFAYEVEERQYGKGSCTMTSQGIESCMPSIRSFKTEKLRPRMINPFR
jgi:hypothetical protein